ncbi:LysR family transcriptional regulator [Vibrio ziniensis]|uniref:LysR family transcriptional regulator n=1 Tax=Vibrio ziniensis TaxID=2711221 RepID=A0A6G7CHU0_9VIBR|nr:LysR family transcriptional regulator [Vibrio ziniensis]QIH41659.1 LysR family transcriptional regulator [Vibrio ziniensis]
MNLSIKQFKAFLLLSECGSFTQAAKLFNLSQPAFSALIASLEEEIGYRLFDRDTRKVELNADGIHFIDIARRLVQNHDDAISAIEARAAGNKGNIMLSVLPSLAVEWLPDILVQYGDSNPDTHISLNDTQWDICLKSLLDGESDLALTAGQPSINTFDSTFLFSDRFYLLCHKDHPLAIKPTVSLEELTDHSLIGFKTGTSIRQYMDKLADTMDKKFSYRLEVRQLTTMMGLVSTNYGVSIVTGLTLFQFKDKNIAIIPFRDLVLERAIYLVSLKGRTQPSHVSNFANFIIQKAKLFNVTSLDSVATKYLDVTEPMS